MEHLEKKFVVEFNIRNFSFYVFNSCVNNSKGKCLLHRRKHFHLGYSILEYIHGNNLDNAASDARL